MERGTSATWRWSRGRGRRRRGASAKAVGLSGCAGASGARSGEADCRRHPGTRWQSGGRSVQRPAYGSKLFSWRVIRSGSPGPSPATLINDLSGGGGGHPQKTKRRRRWQRRRNARTRRSEARKERTADTREERPKSDARSAGRRGRDDRRQHGEGSGRGERSACEERAAGDDPRGLATAPRTRAFERRRGSCPGRNDPHEACRSGRLLTDPGGRSLQRQPTDDR